MFAFGDALVRETAVQPPHPRDANCHHRLLECERNVVAGNDKTMCRPALSILWASQHCMPRS